MMSITIDRSNETTEQNKKSKQLHEVLHGSSRARARCVFRRGGRGVYVWNHYDRMAFRQAWECVVACSGGAERFKSYTEATRHIKLPDCCK
uniref:Uncharacterized protein n=1 Tax=Anopheles dirus TaxID=7168 RepID=A0A182NWM5_9DIPT